MTKIQLTEDYNNYNSNIFVDKSENSILNSNTVVGVITSLQQMLVLVTL